MNTKALKQKILDLAIHGKLLFLDKVEKIRKEEPASILLEKIRAEKQEKIAKGELKKDKKDSFIFLGDDKRHYEKFTDGSVKDIEDEIPFDIPNGWSWCRLGEIVDVLDSKRKPITKSERSSGIYPYYGATSIQDYVSDYIFDEDLLLLGEDGAKWGKGDLSAFCVSGKCWVNNHAHVLRPKKINRFYLSNVLNIFDLTPYVTGTTVPKLNQLNMYQILIPLPPLSEQQLIVSEIEKIFAQIDLLEQNKTDLQTAIKQAKSKILDLAIHAKLVPQDSNDEPASILLEKIRAEKQEKIAKGELKKDKKDSFIFLGDDKSYYEKFADGSVKDIEDEIPFAIPDNWQWCRITSLVSINLGLTHTPKYVKTGIPFYSVKDISNGYLDESNPKYVTQEEFDSFLDGAKPKKGDIIFCRVGTIGKPHIVNVDYPFGIFVSVGFFRKYSTKIDSKFITNWMNSSLFSDQVEYNVKGGVIKNLNTGWLSDFFIPIPPFAEQQRIVSKIEEIFAILDRISSELGTDI